MKVSMMAALADNRVIGVDGDLPWHLPDDLRYFKTMTLGKPVIMGRLTYDTMDRPLPKRPNIVVTRNRDFTAEPGVAVVNDVEQALKLAKDLSNGGDEIMVIGGGQIYSEAMPYADRLYLTEVHMSPQGDAYFPDFDTTQWREVSRDDRRTDEGLTYSFVVLDRIVELNSAG